MRQRSILILFAHDRHVGAEELQVLADDLVRQGVGQSEGAVVCLALDVPGALLMKGNVDEERQTRRILGDMREK